jgi:hypothetical protein
MSGNSITGEMGIDNIALSLKWSNVGDLYMPLAEVKFANSYSDVVFRTCRCQEK